MDLFKESQENAEELGGQLQAPPGSIRGSEPVWMEPRASSSSHVAKLSWSLISKWDQALIRVENELRGQFWKNKVHC